MGAAGCGDGGWGRAAFVAATGAPRHTTTCTQGARCNMYVCWWVVGGVLLCVAFACTGDGWDVHWMLYVL